MAHKDDLDRAIAETMASGRYILGPKVHSFEQRFAAYLGVGSCVGVANGTDAVSLALRACGVEAGDRVLTVSHTAVATVSAIDWIGAQPVLVDIDPVTYTLDPVKAEETIKHYPAGEIKAIVAVHIYGHPANMEALGDIAQRHGIPLVEDCAQAHGARFGAMAVGSIGDCGAFSFYPTKNLGAFGDGGAVVTSQQHLVDQLRLLQQYGWRERYISVDAGYNSRLDELQAAILDCKLVWLDTDNDRRRQIARTYTAELSKLPLSIPLESVDCHHVYHQYVIRSDRRDQLKKYLESQGVMTSILYPVPIHLQPGYSERVEIGFGAMTETERAAKEILCLPVYPELADSSISMVIDAIKEFFRV